MQYKMVKLNGDVLTPVMIFTRLRGKCKFLFESSLPNDSNGRFSFIGADPVKAFIGRDDELEVIDRVTGRREIKKESRSILSKICCRALAFSFLFRFTAGRSAISAMTPSASMKRSAMCRKMKQEFRICI